MGNEDKRATQIAGLRALADLLDAHPDVPVPSLDVCVGSWLGDEAGAAKVTAIAAAFGAGVRSDAHSIEASCRVEGLTVHVFHVWADAMARYHDQNSYSQNVVSDAPVAVAS